MSVVGASADGQNDAAYAPPMRSRSIVVEPLPVLRIDGVVAAEILRCYSAG